MIFLILTDSVALPRPLPEQVELYSTWPYILRKELDFEFVQTSIGAATSTDLLIQTFYYKAIEPRIVLVQCGIVDLAPRAFLPYELELLNKFRITRYLLKKIRKNKNHLRWIRNFRKTTYVSLKSFEKNLKKFKDAFGTSLYWVNIPFNIDEYEREVPGILNNIQKYNLSIKNILGENTIDIAHFSSNEVMSDFHHLNKEGHGKLANKILDTLRQNNVIE